MTLPTEDFSPEDTPPLVTWMAPGHISLGAAGLATAIAGAFALGIVVAVGLLAATRRISPARRPTVH